jgi:hypothetical protein
VRDQVTHSYKTDKITVLYILKFNRSGTHLHLVSRSKNEWSYISTPPLRVHGVVLS